MWEGKGVHETWKQKGAVGGARWQEPGEENQLKSIMLENDMTNILYVK